MVMSLNVTAANQTPVGMKKDEVTVFIKYRKKSQF